MHRICEPLFVIRVLQELLFEIFEILQKWENVDEDVRTQVQAVISFCTIYILNSKNINKYLFGGYFHIKTFELIEYFKSMTQFDLSNMFLSGWSPTLNLLKF